ncbi:MAG: SDR family oxidoreductase [Acidimicrobiia bacterium]|nr:SDR family oxidoreductase [Acidimicrobiia bacterium]
MNQATPSDADMLYGRVALVTGVSRPVGIGAAIAQRLHVLGATVHATGWPPHDQEMPWGEQPLDALPFAVHRHDLEDPAAPTRLVDEAVAAHGRLDLLIAVHARSSHASLDMVDAVELDRCWAANVRSTVLLAQRFAQVHRPPPIDEPPIGRMIWFTSGQHLGPMDGEIAYAATKGALHQLTKSIGHALAPQRIVVNCINPGPIDTGYATGRDHERIASMFPDGRWGSPDDIADIVELLTSDKAAWIRDDVIDAEGGFHRFA